MYKQVIFRIRFKKTLILYFVYVLNFATFVGFSAQ
jgi:nitrate/nitrite transporter NarK